MRLKNQTKTIRWLVIIAILIGCMYLFVASQSEDPTADPTLPSRRVTAIDVGIDGAEDFSGDNWSSEELAERIQQLLNQLKSGLSSPKPANKQLSFVAARVDSRLPNARTMQSAYEDAILHVRRQNGPGTLKTYSASELLNELGNLIPDGKYSERQIALKITGIQLNDGQAETTIRYEASDFSANRSVQQTAIWDCVWDISASQSDSPRLIALIVRDAEEVTLKAPGGRLFIDATESAFHEVEFYSRQVLPGIPSWLPRIPKELISQFGHHGMAIGDVNSDGLEDLYVCDAGGLPNRLYVQRSDGTLKDLTSNSGVDYLDDSVGALLIDLDNDGDQDLVVGTDPILQIAENDGRGRFSRRGSLDLGTDSFSITAADYDRDGYLDLYICGYDTRRRNPTERGLPFPLPYHDAKNGAPNRLLKNTGNFEFQDVTAEVGLDDDNRRFTMAASWEDFDNDGDLDLYVANDFGPNNLFRNDEGSFIDIARLADVVDHGSGMSVSWGDYDRDGWMDLYVGNMFSSAGNRITFQDRFRQGVPEATTQHLQRMARGNTLFRNRSTGQKFNFEDVSLQAGVAMGRWAWASRFADIQNSGWPDLLISNGYLTNAKIDDL